VHSAEIASVPIGTKYERSAFRHVYLKQWKMSACVCVGSRNLLQYKTVGVAYGRYLCSNLCRHCYHRCRVHCAAAVHSPPLPAVLAPLLSTHCCRVHCAAAVLSTQLTAVFAPLLSGTLCCLRPLTTVTGHSLPSTHCCYSTPTVTQ